MVKCSGCATIYHGNNKRCTNCGQDTPEFRINTQEEAQEDLMGDTVDTSAPALVASPHGANLGLARIGCLKLGKTELGFMLGRWPG